MQIDEIKNVAVVGAGLMGHGIALEFALAGYQVGLNDLTDELLHQSMERIRGSARVLLDAGLIDEASAAKVPDQVRISTDLEAVSADADIVIEAMAEDLHRKREVLRTLDHLCSRRTILASNSSSFAPSRMADATHRPDKVVGTHYFNPPFLIPLVEIIRGRQTSDETVALVHELMTRLGKSPVIVEKEVPGFIANRLQAALIREALDLVESGVATPQDVDQVITTSIGRRWAVAGVFEVTEIAGLDLKKAILTELLPSIASSPEVPSILKQKVERGELGIKSGKGFYDWTPEKAAALRARIARALIEIERWK